jgi:hypothetical protein
MTAGEESGTQFAGQVRVLQIIVGAVALGPVTYLGVVLATAAQPNPDAAADEFLTYVACGLAVAAVAAWFVVPPLVTTRFRRQVAAGTWPPQQADSPASAPVTDASKLCSVYIVRTIIAVAILEGAAFLQVLAYQKEGNYLALGPAVLLTTMIALHLPTRTRVAEWVERQLVRLSEDRQMAPFRG